MNELARIESEAEKLRREIVLLRERIAALTAERDDLRLHVCQEILAEYNEKIGALELQAEQLETEILRRKRMIEQMQAEINRDRSPSYEKAKEDTEEEYRAYQEKLNRMAEERRRAEEYASRRRRRDAENRRTALSENRDVRTYGDDGEPGAGADDTNDVKNNDGSADERLKRLYRTIVKRLHPDINPDLTEAQRQMFRDAVTAYKEGDLHTLEEIIARMEEDSWMTEDYSSETDTEKLRRIRDELKGIAESIEREISEIKASFPYDQREFLADDKAVEKRRSALLQYVNECKAEIERLDKRIKELSKYKGRS